MSIGELTMLVNDNFDKPLNQQIRDMKYLPSYLFTSSRSFSVSKTGWYKVIVVGAGGENFIYWNGSVQTIYTGGSGGVAVSTLYLDKNNLCEIEVHTDGFNTATGYYKFLYEDNDLRAYNGETAVDRYTDVPGKGGTASGGDFNYNGLDGSTYRTNAIGTDVGVFIPELMKVKTTIMCSDNTAVTAVSGNGILGYGCGSGTYAVKTNSVSTPKASGCVLIIPLELTE